VEHRVLPDVQINESDVDAKGQQNAEYNKSVAENAAKEPTLFVGGSGSVLEVLHGYDQILVGVDLHGCAVDHRKLVEKLHWVQESHVEHPGADANKHEAYLYESN